MTDDQAGGAGGWREAAKAILEMAENDPDEFQARIKRLALKLNMTADQVYQKLQEDPDFGKKIGKNYVIKNAAGWLKKQLGV